MSMLGWCAITVAVSVCFDWFAFSSGGPELPDRDLAGWPQEPASLAGILLGLAPWFVIGSTESSFREIHWGQELVIGPIWTYWSVGYLPIMLAGSWVVGGALTLFLGSDPRAGLPGDLVRSRRYLRPLLWLGPVAPSCCTTPTR